MELVETGLITIKPRQMNLKEKGSFRLTRDVMRIGHAASAGDPKAFESMLDVIVAHSEIEAPEGGDVRELLLDELSMEEAKEIVRFISGVGAVSPTNGGRAEAG